MSRALILDPRSENPAPSLPKAQAPLEIFRDPGMGPGIYTTGENRQPAELEQALIEGNEGGARSRRPKRSNRLEQLGLYVMEGNDPAATNLAQNPKGEAAIKFASVGDFVVTRELDWTDGVPSFSGEYRDRHSYDGTPTPNLVLGQLTGGLGSSGSLPAAGTYCFSLYVWIPANWTGGELSLVPTNYTGSTIVSTVSSSAGARDRWQRIYTIASVVAGDLTGALELRTASLPSSAATGIAYSDALQVESGSSPTAYFDGESPSCAWSLASHGSPSTRPAPGGTRFELILAELDDKLEKLAERGGTLSRPFRAGRALLDVETARDTEGEITPRRWAQGQQERAIELEVRPYMRGPSVAYAAVAETTLPVVKISQDAIPGTAKALGELTISDTEAGGQDRRTVVAGFKSCRTTESAFDGYYYQAEALTKLSGLGTGITADATASGGSKLVTDCGTDWTAVMSTDVSGNPLNHEPGTYRVFVRTYLNTDSMQYRLRWAQGSLERKKLNDVVYGGRPGFSAPSRWVILDLGLVTLEEGSLLAGQYGVRWRGELLARNPKGTTTTVAIDDVRIVPVDDGYLKSKVDAGIYGIPAATRAYDALDNGVALGSTDFSSTGTAATWAAATGSDADAFKVDSSAKIAYRDVATADTARRVEVLPLALSDVQVETTVGANAPSGSSLAIGVAARVQAAGVSAGLYLEAVPDPVSGGWSLVLNAVGGDGLLGSMSTGAKPGPALGNVDRWTLRLDVYADGVYAAWWGPIGGPLELIFSGRADSLKAGGALASGSVGFTSSHNSSVAAQRTNAGPITVRIPTREEAIFATRSLKWRHDGVTRQDSAGNYAPAFDARGDLLKLPPAGQEQRVLRGIVFATPGDVDGQLLDGTIADLSAQLTVTPRYPNARI